MLDLDTLWADGTHISFLEINSYVPPKMKYQPHRPTDCQDTVPNIILFSPKKVLGSLITFFLNFLALLLAKK